MLQSGQTLLHYRIAEKLGEGGMGVVWKAVDTTLDREVAIKVLPEMLAADPERLARFEREARLLAALNHPNVAAVHSVHEAGGLRFLAMELVGGEDLAQRLARGPLPVDEAIAVARQIAEGLEAAHEAGIVHRDLKPANVKVTADGRVKVLDFGLAKAMLGDPVSSGTGTGDIAASPTLTTAGTVAGVILGTASYMSPEQARGKPVDRRADVWAFGCLLHEMLTGRRLFDGETVSDVLAAVLRADVDHSSLPANVPKKVRRLLWRCLDRDPRTRLRDIGEARVALASRDVEEEDESGRPATTAARPPGARSWLVFAAVAVAALAAGALLSGWLTPKPEAPVRRLSLSPPAEMNGPRTKPRISPDGTAMAYLADGRLWVQELDRLTARPVTGGEDAQQFAWSPDGRSLVFTVRTGLWRTGPSGDPAMVAEMPSVIADTGGAVAWTGHDTIVFTTGNDNIYEVPVAGGTPRVLLAPDMAVESDFHQVFALPDDRGILYPVHRTPQGIDTLEVLADGRRKVVLHQDDAHYENPSYAASGHIIFQRLDQNGGVWAVPFSLSTLETTGDPFLVAVSGSHATVSLDGTLLYSNIGGAEQHQLLLVGRDGKILESIGEPVRHSDNMTFSPEGGRFTACIGEGLWVYDLERDARSLVDARADCGSRRGGSAWSADGAALVFGNLAASEIHEVRADGSGGKRVLTEGLEPDVDRRDEHLVFVRETATTRADIWTLAPDPGATPEPLVATEAREDMPRLSPAGGLMAYVSDETGRTEIYVREFPSGTGRWQVSTDGGDCPRWSASGDRLYYLHEDEKIVEVDVALRPAVRFGRARELFGTSENFLGPIHGYDVSPDGQRFVTVQELHTGGTGGDLTLVTNWTGELRRQRP